MSFLNTTSLARLGKSMSFFPEPLASIAAQKRRIRFPVPDSLIAAAVFARGLTVVTRNVRDFVPLGVPVFNPWTGQSFNTPA
jgi:hypothetical protein